MQGWQGTSQGDLKRFQIIAKLLGEDRRLLSLLFDPSLPRLRVPAHELVANSRGLCSGDVILLRLAIDLWCEQGEALVNDLLSLDDPYFQKSLIALIEVRGFSTGLESMLALDLKSPAQALGSTLED